MTSMKYFLLASSFIIISLFSSCTSSHSYITARTYPYNRKDLASYHMDTPDPIKVTQLPSQIIVIHWNVGAPSSSDKTALYSIHAYIRLQDGEEKEKSTTLSSLSGTTRLELSQNDYIKHGGITSYKILILENDKQIAETRHKLWEDKIIIRD